MSVIAFVPRARTAAVHKEIDHRPRQITQSPSCKHTANASGKCEERKRRHGQWCRAEIALLREASRLGALRQLRCARRQHQRGQNVCEP